jgi:thiamine-phosphate pyrophosphorylase
MVFQLRDKSHSKKWLLPLATGLQAICRQNGVLFIINEHLDLALAVGAGGLHLEQDDLPAETARRLLPPDMLLGCSVFTPEQALAAETAGADYLTFSPVYPAVFADDKKESGIVRLSQIKK